MNHGSLFNGIGGFQLAASWMGWENVMSCEIDDFCNKVTKQHFPNCIQHGDIKTTDFTIYRGRIDILTGGFPCQPFSTAGKRKGTADDRHLWPEMLRAIGEIQPGWIVGENVRGLINWSKGLVFDEVQANLEAEGYEVAPFLLPACAINAPHRRERIWFIANNNGDGQFRNNISREGLVYPSKEWQTFRNVNSFDGSKSFTDAISQGLQKRVQPGRREDNDQAGTFERGKSSRAYSERSWSQFPTQSPLCGRNDGIPNRVDRIKALGNAIVPQVAYQIFKAIEEYEDHHTGNQTDRKTNH